MRPRLQTPKAAHAILGLQQPPSPPPPQIRLAMATAARALRLLSASLHRRPTAAAAFTSAAAASRGSAVLRSSASSGRLALAAQRLGALHGAAVVCSAAGADGASSAPPACMCRFCMQRRSFPLASADLCVP